MDLFITARKTEMCWVFDHEHQNTVDEPLCNGTETAIDITLIGRYYERFADHAVSVARRVYFLVTGKFSNQ